MKSLPTGKTYPFDAFPLEGRIDLLKATTEVYYCLFHKDTPDGRKYGLFRNNLKGDGLESRITESYTVIGEEFGYDEVKVCPTGVGLDFSFAIFVSLFAKNPDTCELISLSESDGARVLISGQSHTECSDALKDLLGMSLIFGDPDYFESRKSRVGFLMDIPSADALYKLFGGKYEFVKSPDIRSFGDESCYVGVVKKADGKFNYLNFTTGEELSPVDFDSYAMMGMDTCYQFKVGKVWLLADLHGVLPDYRLGAKGWYSYDCLPDLLAGKEISKFKQDQYQEHRGQYQSWNPNENNPEGLLVAMRKRAKAIGSK